MLALAFSVVPSLGRVDDAHPYAASLKVLDQALMVAARRFTHDLAQLILPQPAHERLVGGLIVAQLNP